MNNIYDIITETFDDNTISKMTESVFNNILRLERKFVKCDSFKKMLGVLSDLIMAYKTLDMYKLGKDDNIKKIICKYEKAYINVGKLYDHIIFDDVEQDFEFSDNVMELENSIDKKEMDKLEYINIMKKAGIYNIPDAVSVAHNTDDFQYDYTFTNDNLSFANPLSTETTENKDDIKNSVSNESGEYEFVNQPTHYNTYDMPVIDMMEKIWGKEDTAKWCKMTAWKYRQRMGTKPGESIKKDLDKEKWYLDKYNELINK